MTVNDAGRVDVEGDDEIILLIEHGTRVVVGAAFAEDDDPRWWRGVYAHRTRRLFVPDGVDKPGLDVARRLIDG
ncbi:hypothetical protein [Spirillospora albida]|uniref:hypothetical protein n=1 Tax=Spirillospora albida TaxID=58123 RepID=UPI0004C09548|nr:hypothetical protein [Spirillospora albida]